MKNKVNYDLVIKDFFENIYSFLSYKLNSCKNDEEKAKNIELNMLCMSILGKNPARFSQKASNLSLSSDGMGKDLLEIVDKMLINVRSYYDADVSEPVMQEQNILRLAKQAKKIMIKDSPLVAMKLILAKSRNR